MTLQKNIEKRLEFGKSLSRWGLVRDEEKLQSDKEWAMFKATEALIEMEFVPDWFYRFRSCNNEYWEENLKTDTIWMSSFEDFNDPYDGAMKYDPVKLHSLITSHPMKTVDAGMDLVIENCMCEPFPEKVRSLYKAACFTESVHNMLMWSHYADYHKGFCLAYSAKDIMYNLLRIFPVVYTEERVDATDFMFNSWVMANSECLLDSPDFIESNGMKHYKNVDATKALKAGLFKAPCWSYEREWRLIDIDTSCKEMPKIKPSRIFYRCKMSMEQKKRIHQIAVQKGLVELEMYIDNTKDGYKMQYDMARL